ncbi:hypothetical protein GGQ80_002101 [Sphingomonas jinjuensis]|uniref:Uncharacterized protein n=1 Tax=Sphingomonas jinjuensis TaxID=535907 RepID=A0A840FBW6_9SPHN|nr:hypothetical protein [Sphingomonas jinjuensis]MBB4154191.1 hypothetical protein [Sphingomonas jinjuensis]
MADITRKQGDTLLAYFVVRDEKTGLAVNVVALGVVVTSEARLGRDIVQPITVEAVTRNDEPAFKLSADTIDWQVGDWRWDIQLKRGRERISTDTMTIEILEDVTE